MIKTFENGRIKLILGDCNEEIKEIQRNPDTFELACEEINRAVVMKNSRLL